MELDELRSLTRDRLQHGELPREKCQVTWFGPGVGLACDLCRRPILRSEIECECEQPSGSTLFDMAAQRAILNAAPFGPLPREYGQNPRTIRALFKPSQ